MAEASAVVIDALWDNNSPTTWNDPPSLNFAVQQVDECAQTNSYDIEIHIYAQGNGPCNDDPYAMACVKEDPSTNVGHNYGKMRIHMGFEYDHFLINHEIGHTIGFQDPTGGNDKRINKEVSQNYDTCRIMLSNGLRAPVWSVMHAGYCNQVPNSGQFGVKYPTIYDLASFEENID